MALRSIFTFIFLLILTLHPKIAQAQQSDWDELDPQLQQTFTDFLPGGKERFDKLSLQLKVSAACVMSRILGDKISLKNLGQIKEIGVGGALLFDRLSESSTTSLKTDLKQVGFTTNYGATHKKLWGFRSSKSGAELHVFQSSKESAINFHLDLENPSNVGNVVTHFQVDMNNWDNTHSLTRLINEVKPNGCGLGKHILSQVKALTPQPVAGPTPVR